MMRRCIATLALSALTASTAWAGEPLRGFSYGQLSAPTGKEWQDPEAYAHNKQQPRATLYHFGSDASALRVLPEHSEYYMSLDGKWRFHWVGNPEERPTDFYKVDYDDKGWDVVDVPMNWNVYGIDKTNGKQRYGTPIYVNQPVIFYHKVAVDDWRGGVMRTPPEHWTTYKHRNEVGSYRRSFTLPKTIEEGRQIYLQFDGVDSFFYLWVNGQYVGFSKNSRNRAEFDISPYLKAGGENTLAVEVYRSSDGSFLESQDMFRLPGIFRSVSVVSRPKVQIRDLQVLPDLSGDLAEGTLALKAELSNLGKRAVKGYQMRYQLYSLPLYSDEGAEQVGAQVSSAPALTLAGGAEAEARHTLTLQKPQLWSAEAPHRYVLVASLVDKSGRLVDKVSTYVGFRKVEIKDVPASEDEFGLAGRYFLINGKPAKLKGVNRHETHPATGHVLTRAQMEEEVMLMMRANINHVRNSHYPPDSYFYYLCDKYGLYLEDEANIESHQYYYGKESLSHVKEFDIPTTARVLEMVYANYNHPSIVIWSLGNEAGPGVNFVNAYNALKRVDASRPVQYERNNDIVDMGSNQYPSIPWVREAVKGQYKIKYPFHISEYAHSMGNAVGGLQDYWTAMESTNFFCGGAIWDWVDQSLYNYTSDGMRYIAYGGDFGDTPNDGMFVMNGIIFADRTPKPQYYEVKKVYQNVGITAVEGDSRRVRLFNKRYYTDLSKDYDLYWRVYREGKPVEEGKLAVPAVAPRSAVELTIPYTAPAEQNKEYMLRIELRLKRDMPWAKAGYVQADEQLHLQSAKLRTLAPEVGQGGKLRLVDGRKQGGAITVSNDAFSVSFDSKSGIMSALRYGTRDMIVAGGGARIDAFRAAADNDNWAYPEWARNGLHNLQHRVTSAEIYPTSRGGYVLSFLVESQAPHGAEIKSKVHGASGHYEIVEKPEKPFGEHDFKFISAQTWTIHPDGSLELQANITSNKPRLALARLGFEMVVPERYQRYSYYGRGPINNYSDRKTSQFVALYHSTVADQFVHFPKPQTMGNREEVRYLTLTDESGKGMLVQAGETMSASALPWSARELLLAPHPHDLPKSRGTHLHVDASANGLGGNSCGQGGPLEESRSFGSPQLFSFVIRPYEGGEVERVALVGDVAPTISRSSSGQIAIHGRDGDLPDFLQSESYEYSLNGGKSYKPYDGSFEYLPAGTVIARSKSNKRLKTSLSFAKAETARLEVVYASSEEAQRHPAHYLVDGDAETYWQTANTVTTAIYPHWVTFDAGRTFTMTGFRYKDMPHWYNGRIKEYIISVSMNGKDWVDHHRGTFENHGNVQEVIFPTKVRTRYIQFKAISGHRNVDYATGAEFVVLSE